ncbi:MAG: hypothetical protein ACXWXL_03310 [Candidatus Binatia bacterium]
MNIVAHRHLLFLNALVGLFHGELARNAAPNHTRAFVGEARQLVSSYLDLIEIEVRNELNRLYPDLQKHPLVVRFLKNATPSLIDALHRQMLNNIDSAKIDLFRFIVTTNAGMQLGQTRMGATIAARKSLKFVHIDRMGRRHSVERYTRTLVRWWLIGAIYDGFFVEAIKKGAKSIALSNGDTILLSDYEDGKTRFGHPNSKILPISIS